MLKRPNPPDCSRSQVVRVGDRVSRSQVEPGNELWSVQPTVVQLRLRWDRDWLGSVKTGCWYLGINICRMWNETIWRLTNTRAQRSIVAGMVCGVD